MNMLAAVWRFGSSLRGWVRPPGGPPRVARRVGIECPHGRGLVEVELLVDRAGRPQTVLRCTGDASCPPTCDQACRRCAEAVLGPAHALIVYPGGGPFHDVG